MRPTDDVRDTIRSLIVLGDNRRKQGHDARSRAKAREAFEEALALASEAGVEEPLRALIELRLADLDQDGQGRA